jgi:hypothetical protein
MRLDFSLPDLPRRRESDSTAEDRSQERAVPREFADTPILRRLESLRERAADHRLPRPPTHGERAGRSQKIPKQRRRSIEPAERAVAADPRRMQRDRIPPQTIGVQIRPEEKKLLLEVGRFRVVRVEDLDWTIYDGKSRLLENDLKYLREKGLVQTRHINLRRDQKRRTIERVEVVTLTRPGRDLLIRQGEMHPDQMVYADLVKPREVEHDSQIYRAYLKEAQRIEQNGGSNLRVQLDFELKSQVQKAIYSARKADPGRDLSEIKQQVAEQFDLPFVNETIQIPDARIEYDLDRTVDQDPDQGSRSGHEDIEVLTAAYHPGHLRSKAQAGFRNYASASDRASLSAKIEDDHSLMCDILEL